MPQARRVPMLPPQGWLHHDDDLRVTRDEAWGCFAVFFNGMQVATATEPPPAISPSYLSWVAPARFYGEVQYLGEGEDGPSVMALQVCSYRVIARARQARKRSLAKADWEILQAWVGTLQGMDLEQAGDLIRSLKAKIEPLNPGWSQDIAMANIVRALIEEVCRAFLGVEHRMLYKWVRLFLG